MSLKRIAAAFAAVVLLAEVPALAQEARGTIQGTITDSSGGIIPGVAVQITHLATNQVRNTESNATGNYSAPLLPEGIYRIEATRAGFKRVIRNGIELRINDNLQLDLVMEVGAATESVTITAETPLLETSNASVSQVVDSKQISELPVAFGSPFQLMRVGGSVNFSGSSQTQNQPWEPGASVNYNMAGSGQQTANITMDGADNSVRDQSSRATIPNYVPPADAIQEFKLQMVSFDATTGASQGGVMNVSLKSGTNNFHGTGYFNFIPQNWTANQFFSNLNRIPRQAATVRQWGGSANGPVWIPKVYNGRNRTFFMYAYEGIHYASPRGTNYTVPTAAERAGDFSALLAIGPQYQIYNPFTRVAVGNGRYQEMPFPGNIIPPSLISPIATALLNAKNYPLPLNGGTTADGSTNLPEPGAAQHVNFYTDTVRVDHIFSEKSRMFGRYNRYKAQFADPQFFGADSIYSGTHFFYIMDGAAFDEVYTISPTFLMDVKVSDARYVRAQDSNPGGVIDLSSAYGFPASYNNLFDPSIRRTPQVNLSSFSGFSGSSYAVLWQPQENRALGVGFNKEMGSHGLKFGFEYRQYIQNQYNPGSGAQGGIFNFDSTYTAGPFDNSPASQRGQDLAALLLGVPTSGSAVVADNYAEKSTLYGLYFQDDWKATRKLTLTLGLRWELEGPLTERYNRSADYFDPTLAHPAGSPLVAGGANFDAAAAAAYAAHPIAQLPASQFSTLGGIVYAGANGNSRELFHRDWREIMPRLGAAYALGTKTVLRGGYGIYYGALGQRRGDVLSLNFSQSTNLVPTLDNGLTFTSTLANPYPSGLTPALRSTQGADTLLGQSPGTLFNPNLPAQREQHWQFDIQRQLPGRLTLEVGYLGTHGSDLQTTRTLNALPNQYLSTAPTRDQATIDYLTGNVPNPFAGLLPGTSYNSSVIQRANLLVPYPQYAINGLKTQTAEGFNWYQAGYVQLERRFSSGVSVQFSYTHSRLMDDTSFLNAYDPKPQKVISTQDFPNHIGMTSIYELPFGRGKALLANTNKFLTPVVSGWQVSGIWTFQSGRPLGFGNAIYNGGDLRSILNVSNRSIYHYFDTSGFTTASNQQLSYNLVTLSSQFSWLRAPRQDYIDLSLLKNFRIKETMRGQIRADALNALNHPWLGVPNTTASSTSFGQITSENSVPRRIQVMLKFIF